MRILLCFLLLFTPFVSTAAERQCSIDTTVFLVHPDMDFNFFVPPDREWMLKSLSSFINHKPRDQPGLVFYRLDAPALCGFNSEKKPMPYGMVVVVTDGKAAVYDVDEPDVDRLLKLVFDRKKLGQ